MLTDLLQTDRTYATRENALKALERAMADYKGKVPYVIATTADGRFAPVVVGIDFIQWVHKGITVVG